MSKVKYTGNESYWQLRTKQLDVFLEEVVPEFEKKAAQEAQRIANETGELFNGWKIMAFMIASEYHPKLKISRPAHRQARSADIQQTIDEYCLFALANHKHQHGLSVGEIRQQAKFIDGARVSESTFDKIRARNKELWQTLCKEPKAQSDLLNKLLNEHIELEKEVEEVRQDPTTIIIS